MALFSSNLKKMQNELSNSSVDWERMVSLSSGRCDLSGKNSAEGRQLIITLVRKAAETSGDDRPLGLIFRNIISKIPSSCRYTASIHHPFRCYCSSHRSGIWTC
ncbi:MAG: hypothetical protein B1H09_03790 [Gemmatimonadaceae bacterium 4484_173]|nr:MAG: hypothetical protein B1H09_03790 [Gemmatimonadaceae bacterium 4484_173]